MYHITMSATTSRNEVWTAFIINRHGRHAATEMSLPPQLICVKRKRDEQDAPVTFLRMLFAAHSLPTQLTNLRQLELESTTKRHRRSGVSGWVYRRKDIESSTPDEASIGPPSQALMPVIQATHVEDEPIHQTRKARHISKGDGLQEAAASASLGTPHLIGPSSGPAPSKIGSSIQPEEGNDADSGGQSIEPRRYHYSRAASGLAPSAGRSPRSDSSGISKKERYGPVFVEKRKSVSATMLRAKRSIHELASKTLSAKQETSDSHVATPPPSQPSESMGSGGIHRPLPVVDAAVSIDRMTAVMNAWAMEEIAINMSTLGQSTNVTPKKPSSRFRPKAPAQRYAERNPELVPAATRPADEDDKSSVNDSDADCVYDTYERVPANTLTENYNPRDVGVLIIDDDDDAEIFYWPEEDSEEDEEDDEDENGSYRRLWLLM